MPIAIVVVMFVANPSKKLVTASFIGGIIPFGWVS
jgi:hypothetical protein